MIIIFLCLTFSYTQQAVTQDGNDTQFYLSTHTCTILLLWGIITDVKGWPIIKRGNIGENFNLHV